MEALSMARLRTALAALVLGSAIISRSAVAQHGSSVSLTHTVSVSVPPRVKVQVGSATVAQSPAQISSQPSGNGLSLSISATQPWALSIGAVAPKSKLQWSRDGQSEFNAVTNQQSTVASGTLSQTPTSATIFVRPAVEISRQGGGNDSAAVMLTVVAQ
jgi:spore coat protein U-like protein